LTPGLFGLKSASLKYESTPLLPHDGSDNLNELGQSTYGSLIRDLCEL